MSLRTRHTPVGDQSGAYTLDQAADYWISVKSALAGQENYVILNIGNEPFGNNAATPGWTTATATAINRLRSNGFEHPIMVDAPNWGQDWQHSCATTPGPSSPPTPAEHDLLDPHVRRVRHRRRDHRLHGAFQTAGLPLVVGEFGFNHSDGDPDEDTIHGPGP